MKTIKLLALMLVALVGMTACSDDDNNESKLIIEPIEPGYIFVTSGYFTNMYYGNNAVLTVDNKDGKYSAKFSDPQWGEAIFEDIQIDNVSGTVSGTGTLTMVYRGKEGTYNAGLSGSFNNNIIITLPEVMGGTTITLYKGEAPLACLLNGSHIGTNSVMVGGTMGPYDADITCKVSANPDGTINIEIPEYELHDTAIGNLTVGKVTIKNIAYDEEKKAFYSQYAQDDLKEHIKIEGKMTIDGDYPFAADSFIQIEQTEAGIKFTDSFSFGSMPFAIVSTFETVAE
ncbi:MAG: hypothetical protein J5616_08840 [Bacteroidaceae bacterium]|nr:hypothetical protein [Bacteroidaceae bacterium]